MSKEIKPGQFNKDWAKALKMFYTISAWIVIPIVFSLFLGNWLDEKYQTGDFFTLTSVAIAFIITCVGIVREALKAIKSLS